MFLEKNKDLYRKHRVNDEAIVVARKALAKK